MPNKCQTNAKQYTKQMPNNKPNKCQLKCQKNAKQYTKKGQTISQSNSKQHT